ncbi:MAG TPA: deoxyuridine 5'-triphosphate nucleotidohydrolase [Dehalococcoidia bacterium]|jgi:dUTP pyrophosphatase|nr:deoxyuridine 5'-triphosphate nucleotidohydrolase [Dehalococcoidia bacterium]|tara:strand:- start:522 stop:1046 length:525 start_codon:yes stop_codon:yes gene_type:complete
MLSGVLAKESILEYMQLHPPLIEEFLDLNTQIQPNGFDLTLKSIQSLSGTAQLGKTNESRILPETAELILDNDDYYNILPGSYIVTINEVVNLPNHIMCLARPRSSLLRSGISVETAVWDAGYTGRSQCLLINTTNTPYRLQKNSRIIQMVFFFLDQSVQEGYSGVYQNENLSK